MSATIVSDTIDNAQLLVDQNGGKLTRRIIMSGLTGNANQKIYNAYADAGLAALGVGYNRQHPVFTGLFNSSLTFTAIDADKVEVVCNYTPFASDITPSSTQTPKLSISSFIQTVETNEDITGTTLAITYSGDPTNPNGIVATAQIDIALTSISLSRLEAAPPIAIQDYVETINSASVSIGGTTFAAKSLKLTGIRGEPKDDSGNYLVTYEILYNKNLWNPTTFCYVKDGEIPAGITGGDGIITANMYLATSWTALHLA